METHCGRPGTGAAGGRETPSCLPKESTEIEPKEREHFLWRGTDGTERTDLDVFHASRERESERPGLRALAVLSS